MKRCSSIVSLLVALRNAYTHYPGVLLQHVTRDDHSAEIVQGTSTLEWHQELKWLYFWFDH